MKWRGKIRKIRVDVETTIRGHGGNTDKIWQELIWKMAMEMERSECVLEFQDLIKYWIWGEEKPSIRNNAQIYDKQDGMNAMDIHY